MTDTAKGNSPCATDTGSSRSWIIHPIAFMIYPFAHLFSVNIEEVTVLQILPFALGALAVAAAAWFAARALLKSWQRGAILVSALVIVFFSYGHVYLTLSGQEFLGLAIGRHRYLVALYGSMLAVVVIFLLRARGEPKRLGSVLDVMALALLVMPIGSALSHSLFAEKPPVTMAAMPPHPDAPMSGAKPDVYYIVLDGYAGETTLSEQLGYDDSAFLKSLGDRGFFVLDRSHANFRTTAASLGSTLNMTYLSGENEGVSIRDNLVMRIFKKMGYSTVVFPSGYSASSDLGTVDRLMGCEGLHEFTITLVETTPLIILKEWVGRLDHTRFHAERVDCQFNELSEVAKGSDGPVFVFAHILSPHPPYIFDENGPLKNRSQLRDLETERTFFTTNSFWDPKFKDYYLGQLAYVSQRLEKTVDAIIANSKVPPIIIIQSDHGPAFTRWDPAIQNVQPLRPPFDRARAEIFERSEILNAIYVRGQETPWLKRSQSPVNTFRSILREVYGWDLPPLEDKILWFQNGTEDLRRYID